MVHNPSDENKTKGGNKGDEYSKEMDKFIKSVDKGEMSEADVKKRMERYRREGMGDGSLKYVEMLMRSGMCEEMGALALTLEGKGEFLKGKYNGMNTMVQVLDSMTLEGLRELKRGTDAFLKDNPMCVAYVQAFVNGLSKGYTIPSGINVMKEHPLTDKQLEALKGFLVEFVKMKNTVGGFSEARSLIAKAIAHYAIEDGVVDLSGDNLERAPDFLKEMMGDLKAEKKDIN